MKMMSIASGSSGNCIYIGSENTHILIDDGISRKRVVEGLAEIGLQISDLSAIFVTHEHSDHINGLGVLLRKDTVKVYASNGTIEGILNYGKVNGVDRSVFIPIEADSDTVVGDLLIHSFRVSHDANEPFAYTVSCQDKKAGVITDLGHFDDYIVENLQGLNSILIEANHDIKMLEAGKYPYYLKRRILGDKGHLSNEASGRLLDTLLHEDLRYILLGHLSHENNYEELAYETVRLEVNLSESKYNADDFDIVVAHRDKPSKLLEL